MHHLSAYDCHVGVVGSESYHAYSRFRCLSCRDPHPIDRRNIQRVHTSRRDCGDSDQPICTYKFPAFKAKPELNELNEENEESRWLTCHHSMVLLRWRVLISCDHRRKIVCDILVGVIDFWKDVLWCRLPTWFGLPSTATTRLFPLFLRSQVRSTLTTRARILSCQG